MKEMIYIQWITYWTADMKSSKAMSLAVMNAIFSNCRGVEKPETFSTSTGFEPVTSRYRCDALTNWAMKPMTLAAFLAARWSLEFFRPLYAIAKNCVHNCEDHSFTWFHIRSSVYDSLNIYHFIHWFIPHGKILTHKRPAPNVSGFIAELARASHRYREVKGSNSVEVLNFSSFSTQLHKFRS